MRLAAVLRAAPSGEITVPDEAYGNGNRRRTERRSLKLSVVTTRESASDTQVSIRDISPRGILIEAEPSALSVDDWIEVNLPDTGPVEGRVVWTSGGYFGCEFDQPISAGALSAALLRARPAVIVDSLVEFESVGTSSGRLPSHLLPELNFFVAVLLSFALWGLIWAAVSMIAN
jgi:hypothetical protein